MYAYTRIVQFNKKNLIYTVMQSVVAVQCTNGLVLNWTETAAEQLGFLHTSEQSSL